MKIVKETKDVLADLAERLAQARGKRKEWEELEKSLSRDLSREFKDRGRKRVQVNDGTNVYAATYSPRTRIDIDEAKLKKALGAKMWNKVTERKLDKSKLEDLVTRGEIDANKVAMCSTEKVIDSIRTTIKKADPEEDLNG